MLETSQPLIPAIQAISHALLFTDAFTVTIDDRYYLPNSAGITPTSVRFRGTRPSYPTMSLDRPETGKTEIVTESSEMTVHTRWFGVNVNAYALQP